MGITYNKNYSVFITKNGTDGTDPVAIELTIPETFTLTVSSTFDQPFSQGASDSKLGTATKVLSGRALTSQAMSAQVWSGSSPISMSMDFQLLAQHSSVNDVHTIIEQLLTLAMPSGKNGLLKPPGPVYAEDVAGKVVSGIEDMMSAADSGNSDAATTESPEMPAVPAGTTSLEIGSYLLLDSIAIESVSPTWSSLFDKNGLPIRADVSIAFKTYYMPVVEDLQTMFKGVTR